MNVYDLFTSIFKYCMSRKIIFSNDIIIIMMIKVLFCFYIKGTRGEKKSSLKVKRIEQKLY